MSARMKRFTVYDKMDADGVFASNPANPDAVDAEGRSMYKGPIAYPKVMYHPTGEQRIVNPGEEIDTPRGPKLINQLLELVSITVRSEAEEQLAAADGWHDHPAKAIAVRAQKTGEAVPEIGADTVINSQEAEIRRLQAELAKLREASRESVPPSVLGKKA